MFLKMLIIYKYRSIAQAEEGKDYPRYREKRKG